jgi:hypothetical protein
MRSSWSSETRLAHRWGDSDRGCPLSTVIDRPMWHASGTPRRDSELQGRAVAAPKCYYDSWVLFNALARNRPWLKDLVHSEGKLLLRGAVEFDHELIGVRTVER